MKSIGILGSGPVARTIGNGFLRLGHSVTLGSGDPSKLEGWKKEAGSNASAGTFADAAASGEIIVLAVKGKAARDVLKAAGNENLKGKTIIDTTNPIDDAPPDQNVLKYFTTFDRSLMEDLQANVPDAHFVKAFNSVGNAGMFRPTFENKPTMFICGNNDAAKKAVTLILDQFGWETADFGAAASARAIEPLCMLWCIPGFMQNEWTHAFKLYHQKV